MADLHRTCTCGAAYRRTEAMALARQLDSFQCSICDATLETWNAA
jgi:predicted SprT family Zn-dependent metalloprotease